MRILAGRGKSALSARGAPWAGAVALLLLGAPAPRAQRYLPSPGDPQHARVIYADSLESLNDRCPVRQNAITLGVRPIYVNGRPVGFC